VSPRVLRLALALFLFLPVFGMALPNLRSDFLGVEYVDHFGTQWFYWYIEREVRALEFPAHTDLFFYPWGKDIFGHTGSNVLDGVFAIPFRMLFGNVLGYNLFVLVGLATNVLAFRLLACDYTDDPTSADAAALFVGFSPYVLFEVLEGRPTQALIAFPILYLRHLLRAVRRPGWRDPAIAGLMLALTGLMYWYYAAFGGLLALALAAMVLVRPDEGAGGRLAVFARLAGTACVALALVAPVALPLVTLSSAGEVPGLLDVSKWGLYDAPPVTREAQEIGIFSWQPFKRYAGFYVLGNDGYERLLPDAALSSWALWPMLLLALWRPAKLRSDALVAMMAVAMLLAMGPILLVAGSTLPNLPYIYLVKAVGFMQRLWWPARAAMFITLLSGLSFVAVFDWLGRTSKRAQVAAIFGLALTWLVDLGTNRLLPFSTWDATVPAGFKCLATGPAGAVIELPYGWTQGHLYYQTEHGRPILGGMLENNLVFTPTELTDVKTTNTWLARVLSLGRLQSTDLPSTDADREAIHALGYRYLLLQLDAFYPPRRVPGLQDNAIRTRLRRVRESLEIAAGPPVYEDARVVIYAPWGGAAPCDQRTFPTDHVAVNKLETSTDERILHDDDDDLVVRLFVDPTAPAPGPTADPKAAPGPNAEPASEPTPTGP